MRKKNSSASPAHSAEVSARRSRSAEKSHSDPSGRLRRGIAFITRRRAVAAWTLAGFAILLYWIVARDSDKTVSSAFGEFFLILAGVAAGAIFLPELESSLWELSAEKVQRLIPNEKREGLARALLSAETREEEKQWADTIYDQGVRPLVAASRTPHNTLRNFTYSTRITLDKTLRDSNGEERGSYHLVETNSSSERVLPHDPSHPDDPRVFRISAAHNEEALSSEFTDPACIAREVVALTDDTNKRMEVSEWREFITGHGTDRARLCIVSVSINGSPCEIKLLPEKRSDLVQWQFSVPRADLDVRVPVVIKFDFPISAAENEFPVHFGYYCFGGTTISFKLSGEDARDRDLRCTHFFGRQKDLGSLKPSDTVGLDARDVSISTGRDSLIWPGSGALFRWRNKSDFCTHSEMAPNEQDSISGQNADDLGSAMVAQEDAGTGVTTSSGEVS